MVWRRREQKHRNDLDPDEIFLDAHNLPSFNTQQFEGRIEKPISRFALYSLTASLLVIGLVFCARAEVLQVHDGTAYANRSKNNTLRRTPIPAERGIVYDRNQVELAWNNPDSGRTYSDLPGLGHILGFIGQPSPTEVTTDKVDPNSIIGKDGVEQSFNQALGGQEGIRIEEVNALGEVTSDHVLQTPQSGKPLDLSIDSRVQTKLYSLVKEMTDSLGFNGGSGVLLDVNSGEVLAMTSYPEYDSNVMTDKKDQAAIRGYLADNRRPFVDRSISGLYAPGSTFKPILAAGALQEGIIDPAKQILSTGSISIPNPYDPKLKSVFKDWRPQGWVDMRHAIAVSSDVYFYEVGGGYPGQTGLGITNINKYARMFGLATTTGIQLGGESGGEIPSPAWKAANFKDDPTWRIGDSYHTAIGQYGVQVTPIQMVRVAAAIANGGKLLTPTVLAAATGTKPVYTELPIDQKNLQVVREGMRMVVTVGTAPGLNLPGIQIAAKTGTAELGVVKDNINSWLIGYFPYDHPKYAFAVVLEHGPASGEVGAVRIMDRLIPWMQLYTSEYTN